MSQGQVGTSQVGLKNVFPLSLLWNKQEIKLNKMKIDKKDKLEKEWNYQSRHGLEWSTSDNREGRVLVPGQ